MDNNFCKFKTWRRTLVAIFIVSVIGVFLTLVAPNMSVISSSRLTSTMVSTSTKTMSNNSISDALRSFASMLTGDTTHKYLYDNKNKQSCSDRKKWRYKPMSKNLPLTALASPWRSGNTWLRHLLQMATGIGTASQYCDRQLLNGGYPFECAKKDLSKYIVRKTHMPSKKPKNPRQEFTELKQYQRAVVIIRDPYTFIVANVYSGHTGVVPENTFFTTKFKKIAQPTLLEWWKMFNNFWLTEFKGEVYPVLYTNFVRDVDGELRKLLDFLGVRYSEDDIECAVNNKEGNFHRKARVWTRISNIKELYSVDMQQKIDNSVFKIAEILKRKYDIDWTNDTYTVNKPK